VRPLLEHQMLVAAVVHLAMITGICQS